MRKIEPEWVAYFWLQSLPYIRVTLQYVFFSLLIGTVIGAVVARGKMSKSRIANFLAGFYVHAVYCSFIPDLLWLSVLGVGNSLW